MAYIGITKIRASGDMNAEEIEGYNTQLQSLVATIEGTLPGNRGFGISPDILDNAPKETLNMLALDLQEKAEKYIPEIEIVGVDGESDEGTLNTQIYIGRRESDD